MGGRNGLLALGLLGLLTRCGNDRLPLGARCSNPTQCRTGLCLDRGPIGAVCVARCAADDDCPSDAVCGRFDFRGRDEAGVRGGVETDVVRVCRPLLQPRCDGGCPAGDQCMGESPGVCSPPCRDRIDCGGRDCVRVGCGPSHCTPACDSLRDCPRYHVCDTAFLGVDGHGRCLPVAGGLADAGVDVACIDAP